MTDNQLLHKWTTRLGLTDWKIELVTNCSPDSMDLPDVVGCTSWTETNKTARIEILDPKFYGYERIRPFNFETILVHELLRLKFSFWCQNTDDISDRAIHQIIDDLARAFTADDSICVSDHVDPFEAVPVVQCKECRYFVESAVSKTSFCKRQERMIQMRLDDYCSYGERKADDKD